MIFLGVLAVFRGIFGEHIVVIVRQRIRIVEVKVWISRHRIDFAGIRVHHDAAGTRLAAGFDRGFLQIFFKKALDFVIDGGDKVGAVSASM